MALIGYELEKKRIDDRIKEIRAQLGGRGGAAQREHNGDHAPKRRQLSVAARKRIAAAQKKRWAAHRKAVAQAHKAKNRSHLTPVVLLLIPAELFDNPVRRSLSGDAAFLEEYGACCQGPGELDVMSDDQFRLRQFP